MRKEVDFLVAAPNIRKGVVMVYKTYGSSAYGMEYNESY